MKKFTLLTALAFITSLSFISCEKDEDDDDDHSDGEIITTIKLNFKPSGPEALDTTYVFTWTDLDGPGADVPVIVVDTLPTNTTFDVTAEFFNETLPSTDDDYNVTLEIEDEDEDHQLFFELSTGSNVTFTYDDFDENNDPVGLKTEATTTSAEQSTLTVSLVHEPAKDADGVSGGDITNAGPSEAEATFDIYVKADVIDNDIKVVDKVVD